MKLIKLTEKKDTDLIILSKLDDKSLFNFCISNPKDKYIEKLCGDESFWRNRLKNNFPEFKNTRENRNWKQTYLALAYYSNKYKPREAMIRVSQKGDKDLVDFFIKKGGKDLSSWDIGMGKAAEGGHRDLIEFFIEKGSKGWNDGMLGAARGGHKDLVEFFIQKGANHWGMGIHEAARGGHKDLVQFLIEKGAKDWNMGMRGAAFGGHKDLVEFFIEKGANNWKMGMDGAALGGHKDLVEFFKQKINLYYRK